MQRERTPKTNCKSARYQIILENVRFVEIFIVRLPPPVNGFCILPAIQDWKIIKHYCLCAVYVEGGGIGSASTYGIVFMRRAALSNDIRVYVFSFRY